jgi:D-aspartate ligase
MQSRHSIPAVIMGLDPSGLPSVRTLGAMGVPCLGMHWGSRWEIGRYSKYLLRMIQVPYPPSHQQLLRALDELTEPWREASPILIPAEDIYAAFIDEMQDALRPRYTLRASPEKLYALFVDKARTIEACSDQGVVIPRSVAIDSAQNVSAVCSDFRFPVIVKPRSSYGTGFPGKNFVASSASELARFFGDRPDMVGRTVAQEVIHSGDGKIVVAFTYSGREGKVLAQVTVRKLRQWRPDYGQTSFGRSELVPEVARITERFLNAIEYQGFAAVEFAEDADTGRYFLLEVNPRLGLPIQLVLDANVDLIRIAYREMGEMRQEDSATAPSPRQIDGVHWIDFRYDVFSFLDKYRRSKLSLSAWLRSLLRASSYATFDVRDPKPFLASSRELARDLLGAAAGAVSARAGGRPR